ncbi:MULTISPECIES: macrolide family glycosyltransferase [unclassified Streptomyces]|uniref:macrolide family glycosyltransferase n=1 Tax=unclassified Streptomyces TaxID=2593676 RepID=UPI003403D134
MGHHVLIHSIPANGHVLPTLAIVAELVRKGHRVTYPMVGDFARMVESVGATVLPYDSVDPVSVVSGPESGRAPLVFLEENLAQIAAAEKHLADDVPDLVLYDGVAMQAGRVLAKRWSRPAVRLSPVFASNEHYSFVQKMMEAAGPVDMGTDAMAEFGEKLGRLLLTNGFEESVQEFMAHVEDLTIVLVPRAFQPAGDTFDERFAFVGPCLADRDFLGEWHPPVSGLPTALVSLGTVNNRDAGFFKATIDAFTDLPWHAVVSVGNGIDPAELGDLPDNVEVRRWVPHLTVLEHAELAVTHAGMGGVMEALRWGRPMVAVPPFPDVVPNAERLAELELGVVLRPADVTAERLRNAILRVSGDKEIVNRTREMSERIREAGGAREVVARIEGHLERVA